MGYTQKRTVKRTFIVMLTCQCAIYRLRPGVWPDGLPELHITAIASQVTGSIPVKFFISSSTLRPDSSFRFPSNRLVIWDARLDD